MDTMDATLQAALDERRLKHLYRQRSHLTSGCAAMITVDGKPQHNFCSNDYLGLAGHPDITAALKAGADQYGTGSGASHLISGHSRAHENLEQQLAEFTGRPRALLFSTGYMANMGVITALTGRNDLVLQDYLNHASLLDGGRLSRADMQRYKHSNTEDLAAKLDATNTSRKLVITDGVFSMDGDLAPLDSLAEIVSQRKGWLMVDDAHGFGVLGKTGGGLIEALGMTSEQVPILVGTLGKAFGTFGAFVAGSESLIETLIQFSRSYIYTTALPPSVAVASAASLKIVQVESWRREKLSSLVSRFRSGAEQIGLHLMDSQMPIQPVQINDDQRVMAINAQLRHLGFMVGAIRPPTVPKGRGRLRICFSAMHSDEQIDKLLEALESVVAQ